MAAYGSAAAIVSGICAVSWVVVATLRKIPVVCREAVKAIKAVRALRDEIRGPQGTEIDETPRPEAVGPQSDDEEGRGTEIDETRHPEAIGPQSDDEEGR